VTPTTQPNASRDRELRSRWMWLFCLLAISGAACSNKHAAPTLTHANTSSTSGHTEPAAAAATDRQRQSTETAVLEAYRRFWKVAADVGRRPAHEWRTRLEPVAAEPFLSELVEGFSEQRERGVVDFGTVELRPTVASLFPTRASILDCQDASRTGEVDRATGEVKTVGSSHTPFTATLTKTRGGGWKVSQARYLPAPC